MKIKESNNVLISSLWLPEILEPYLPKCNEQVFARTKSVRFVPQPRARCTTATSTQLPTKVNPPRPMHSSADQSTLTSVFATVCSLFHSTNHLRQSKNIHGAVMFFHVFFLPNDPNQSPAWNPCNIQRPGLRERTPSSHLLRVAGGNGVKTPMIR